MDTQHINPQLLQYLITGLVVNSLIAVGQLTLTLLAMVRSGTIQKRQISFETEYARASELQGVRNDLEQLEQRIETIRGELHTASERGAEAGEMRARRLHERMDGVTKDLNSAIQNMPAQIIAVLRNTGALK